MTVCKDIKRFTFVILQDCCTSTQLYIRGEPADMAHWTFQESLVDDEVRPESYFKCNC